MHWQYMEDIPKITPHEGTPLKIKRPYIKEYTKKGPVISPVRGPVKVGDELVVRIELRTDRDMEYVHMKDHRGSGTEPVNVLSTYKYQDGLGYYQSTRDTASILLGLPAQGHICIEYSVRVQHRGEYQTGMTMCSVCTPMISTVIRIASVWKLSRGRSLNSTREGDLRSRSVWIILFSILLNKARG